MKTIKLPAVTLLLINIFLNSTVGLSQCISAVQLGSPLRYELQPPSSYYFTINTGTANCGTPATGSATMPGMGINLTSPQYMLDILCTSSTNQDVNVSCPTCTTPNAVGYRIGGQMVLWNEGNASDIYVGVNSGNSGGGANCTAIGYNTLTNNTAAANTAVGYYALYTNTGGGGGNTAVGAGALTANTTAQFNTALGWGALNANTAVGYNALYSKYFNTFIS